MVFFPKFTTSIILAGLASSVVASAGMNLTSPAFKDGATIPHEYSYTGYGCDGKNVSPALAWTDVPDKAKSLALTVFDPDANKGRGWWHWVVYNIRPSTRELKENAGALGGANLPKGAGLGNTDFHSPAYGGPCPPPGDNAHHYVFTLYALDTRLNADNSTSGSDLKKLMAGHVLAKTELVGRFGR